MSSNLEEQPTGSVGEESLGIEVTTHCNCNCPHCFARAAIAEHSSLSPDLVKEIIREGYTARYRRLHITGGEPLLWKGLFAVLAFGFKLGYKAVFLNTNGTILTKDIARRLAGI